MMKKLTIQKLFLFSALTLLVVSAVHSESEKGGYAGAFWQVPLGARPAAMGGAYIGLADDAAGVFYNPSGITALRQPIFGASYRAMKLDRTLGYIHAAMPVRGEAVIGIGWLYAASGTVAARDNDGDLLGYDVGMNNHDFFITFAKRFEKYLSLGARMSYLYSHFAEMRASAVGFDLGVMLHVSQFFDREKREDMSIQDIQVGLVVRRIESTYRWNNQNYLFEHVGSDITNIQEDKVPLGVGLGGSARFFERKLVLTSDFVVKQHLGGRIHAGAEYYVTPDFALRGGYSDGRLTAGTGYAFPFGRKTLAIDYAFSTDRADEGVEHLFSFDFLF